VVWRKPGVRRVRILVSTIERGDLMLRRRHEPQTSPPTDTELDRLQEWVLSLPWVVERPDDDNTAGVTCFAVDCEPLGRRRVWLLAGLTNDHHTSGVAVVLPIDAAT